VVVKLPLEARDVEPVERLVRQEGDRAEAAGALVRVRELTLVLFVVAQPGHGVEPLLERLEPSRHDSGGPGDVDGEGFVTEFAGGELRGGPGRYCGDLVRGVVARMRPVAGVVGLGHVLHQVQHVGHGGVGLPPRGGGVVVGVDRPFPVEVVGHVAGGPVKGADVAQRRGVLAADRAAAECVVDGGVGVPGQAAQGIVGVVEVAIEAGRVVLLLAGLADDAAETDDFGVARIGLEDVDGVVGQRGVGRQRVPERSPGDQRQAEQPEDSSICAWQSP